MGAILHLLGWLHVGKVGYRVRQTKDWIRKAAPVLKAGWVALKLALAAGGTPLPYQRTADRGGVGVGTGRLARFVPCHPAKARTSRGPVGWC